MGDGHGADVRRLSALKDWGAAVVGQRARQAWWVPLVVVGIVASLLVPAPGSAATPSVSEGVVCNANNTSSFVLTATNGYITTPDGNSIFMWGYGLGNNPFQQPLKVTCQPLDRPAIKQIGRIFKRSI